MTQLDNKKIIALKPTLISIVGPTAIGKTALSIKLAQYFDCSILSCDSRQFFKEMTIGTAVPSIEELNSAPHFFIQNISIHENFSVGEFEKLAIAKLNLLFETNNVVIMVGGSGLYVDAIAAGLDVFPEIDKSIRNQLIADFQENELSFLQEKLRILDPFYYQKLTQENPQTLQNPQRLLRFLEVCVGTGKPYSSFLKKHKNSRSFKVISIGIDADRQIIYDKIDNRVDLMMQLGLLGEAERLLPFQDLNALQTVGYKELFSFLNAKCTLEFAVSEIKKNTRRFAKRQLTWFKRNEKTRWFNYNQDSQKIINFITKNLNNADIKNV